ncbi:MAG: DNA repair protein RadA [Patescibacteria group bacterium]
MKNKNTMFVCNNCGNEFSRWLGKCESCGEWNTLKEVAAKDMEVVKEIEKRGEYKVGNLAKLSDANFEGERFLSKIEEWDRVLGGGMVRGSLILIGGEPGIGKSTLMVQVADALTRDGKKVLYVSGEESLAQVGGRAKRLGTKTEDIDFLDSVWLENIEKIAVGKKYGLMIIDSVQTLVSSQLGGSLGSMAQIRYCVARLMQLAKKENLIILLVGHVTKDGEVAGPRVLEHLVDVVLFFEGERTEELRVLRVFKNRFGATDETGVFVMTETGLKSVVDVSKQFLKERKTGVPGSVVCVAMEGTRPFLIEIQAIVDRTQFGNPRRTSVGVDLARLSMLLAVLGKRAKINIYDKDVYVNVVGGFKLKDRSTDLGVVMAISSVVLDKPISPEVAVFGELGLLGEIRRVKSMDKRIMEAKKMGFQKIYGPSIEKRYENFWQVDNIGNIIAEIF